MLLQDIEIGHKVVYIPHHLLIKDNEKEMIKEENLGVVTSKNADYVFVKYKGMENSQALPHQTIYSH